MDKRLPTRAELYRALEQQNARCAALEIALRQALAEIDRQAGEIAELKAELGRQGPGGPTTPSWIKANSPPRPKKVRQKRQANCARARGRATRQVIHAVDACPDCGCHLRGGSAKRHREVIDISPTPAVVTDHVLLERTCPVCAKRCVPTLGAADGVVGQHRFGPRLLGMIAVLHDVGRMTVRTIQAHLASVFGVHVSIGAITDALHTVATRGAAQVAAIRDAVRASPVVHADETGWRQNGQNRYLWVASTDTDRYFAIGRRTNDQIDAILGTDFLGILVTDFYAAYDHFDGLKQRCWAHVLRAATDLLVSFPDHRTLIHWVDRLRRHYGTACDAPGDTPTARRVTRQRLEERITRLCQPFATVDVPQRRLAARLLRHLSELFTFVTHPFVARTNNQAERALRPHVIARKVWGGTRSERGSTAAAARFTLFATWRARGLNPFDQVHHLLLSPGI